MAFCAPPQLIPSDPPIFVTDDPGFESLVSSNMPDPDDLLSGLDALLNSPIGAIDDDLASLDTLDVLLAAATFTPGNWAAANIAPLLALYSTLGISGDALLAVLLGAIANTPAIPGVPPVPPDPGLDLETLCNECNEGEPSQVDINITELPGGENWPQPGTPGGGDCLDPQPSGGYAPGPCPSQQSPAPPPPPSYRHQSHHRIRILHRITLQTRAVTAAMVAVDPATMAAMPAPASWAATLEHRRATWQRLQLPHRRAILWWSTR